MAAEVAGQVEARWRPGGGGSELKQAGWKVLQCPGCPSWMLSVCLTGEGSGTLVVWLSGFWNLAGMSCNVLNFL